MNIVFLSLGTNLGEREHNLTTAIDEIQMRIGPVLAQSAFVATDPWGFQSDNAFLNAAVKIATQLNPYEVLHAAQDIERCMGRTVKTDRSNIAGQALPQYHDRIIDIDILLYFEPTHSIAQPDSPPCSHSLFGYSSVSISSPTLTIPHPHMYERDFVLTPLKQIL